MKINNCKITGTFKYGKLLSMGLFVAFNILLGIGVLFNLGCLIFVPIEDWFYVDGINIFIFALVFGLAVWGFWIWLTIIQVRQRKHIKLWMEDAVLVEGMMTKTADMPSSIREHIYRITVKHEKKKITLEPRSFYTRRSVGLMAVHYYNKYLDRNIYVLYSPKYNQVIFIEQPECMDEIS